MKRLEGLIAAPFTPFDKRGELALGQIEKLARLYENNEVSGAFICGSTGEGSALTFKEKKKVMRAWGDVHSPKLRKIFMLGGTSIKEMKILASKAHKYGMDGISVLCPYYFRPANLERLVDFCSEVARAAPKLPFYYYHIPALTGGHFSMLEFLKLAETKIPNLAGIKYTFSDIMDYQRCRAYGDGKYDLLWGTDEALLSGLAVGTKGAVGSTYNYAAPLYNGIISAFNEGDLPEARRLQDKAVEMVAILVKYGGGEAGKGFMKLIGVDCGWFRSPLKALTAEQYSSLNKDLKSIGFFEFCSQVQKDNS